MSRGISPAGSAAQAAGILLLLGGFAVVFAAGLGCGREEKSDAVPATATDETMGPKQPADAAGRAGGKAGRARAGKSETGKTETGKAGTGKTETGKTEARKAETGKAETGKAGTGKAEAGKAGTGKANAGKRGKKGAPPLAPVIPDVPVSSLSDEQVAAQVEGLRRENARLASEVAALEPSEPYILINTTLNRLSLKRGDEYILKDAVVSTGSNTELVDTKGSRRWFFSTPKGVRTVTKKMVAPVWTKPDWAFVEEGEPVPGAQAEARFEEGTLGKYGLYIGDGYLIHGTLFQRFLGQSVTHGCVRCGDSDIETIYMNASVGTKIYIY
jgi:lipoprotein-anchoring transpeptidase ErfK/SrfK